MRRTQKELVSQLEHEGMTFRQFSMTHVGTYTVADADWNYKDVPHLHHVHALAEATIGYVGDKEIATITTQKVFGITLPLTVFNYQTGENRQTYFTSFGPFSLIIETSYQELEPLKTQVTTTYAVGALGFWMVLFPLVRWALTRNYAILMGADIPMRTRRGELRSWGYEFKKPDQDYSFKKTMEIMESNVVPPARSQPSSEAVQLDLQQVLPGDGVFLWGRSDHLGLQLIRTGQKVSIFPRMCPHEGALLDGARCSKQDRVKCQWHGREFSPYAQIDLSLGLVRVETPLYAIEYAQGSLMIRGKVPVKKVA